MWHRPNQSVSVASIILCCSVLIFRCIRSYTWEILVLQSSPEHYILKCSRGCQIECVYSLPVKCLAKSKYGEEDAGWNWDKHIRLPQYTEPTFQLPDPPSQRSSLIQMVLGHHMSRAIDNAEQLSRTELSLVTNRKIEKRAPFNRSQGRCRCDGTIPLGSAPTLALNAFVWSHFTLVGTDVQSDNLLRLTEALREQELDSYRLHCPRRCSGAVAPAVHTDPESSPSICKWILEIYSLQRLELHYDWNILCSRPSSFTTLNSGEIYKNVLY